MLTNVNFSCGHTAEVNLSNNEQKRLEKIAELELNGLCPDCRKAEWEKEDKKNNKGCVCVRISKEKYEKDFPECKERLTGFPKEKDYTYIFLPIETLLVESMRKYIDTFNVSYKEMADTLEKAFEKAYPNKYNRLQPVVIDEEVAAPAPVVTEARPEVEVPVNIETPAETVEAPVEEVINNDVPSDVPTADDIDDLFESEIVETQKPSSSIEVVETPAEVISVPVETAPKTPASPKAIDIPSLEDELDDFLGGLTDDAVNLKPVETEDDTSDTEAAVTADDVEDDFNKLLDGLI